jgi:hypothetical protein
VIYSKVVCLAFARGRRHPARLAGVAQLVEQLIRNQQVDGSSPFAGSRNPNNFSDCEARSCSSPMLTTTVDHHHASIFASRFAASRLASGRT